MGSGVVVLIIAVAVCMAFGFGGGAFGMRRQDRKDGKAAAALSGTVTRVWAGLAPEQQEELTGLHSLYMQEEWVEENIDYTLRRGVTAERMLIELANRGLIPLGEGTFKRHASPLDFIEPKAPAHPVTDPELGMTSRALEALLPEAPEEAATPVEEPVEELVVKQPVKPAEA